ncbi:hypothetical protein ABEB36_014450 [Hypothenemus hampei]|uniref:BZIP domain-containing protein n=1 Tax=Hypothenemus hampei TaxID=57062 RepID=A0ABD1E2S7_HYPHA
MNILKTGGGSYISTELNNIEKEICEIIGPQVDGLQNTYDDDSELQIESSSSAVNSNIKLNDETITTENEFTDENEDTEVAEKSWESYSSKMLKAPVSEKLTLKQKSRRIVTNKARIEKKEQHEKFLEEHNLKMQILKMELKIKEKESRNLDINSNETAL